MYRPFRAFVSQTALKMVRTRANSVASQIDKSPLKGKQEKKYQNLTTNEIIWVLNYIMYLLVSLFILYKPLLIIIC